MSPAATPLPPWIKAKLPSGANYERVKKQAAKGPLNTVCREARCPNIGECWGGGTATFMVLGDACTRGCRFCSVKTARRCAPPDPEEPRQLARSVSLLSLRYAVITTVCRDDLPDQGAGHLAACLSSLRRNSPDLKIEFLVQDFRGEREPLRTVVRAAPDVLAHNVETVERLTRPVRDAKAGYRRSIDVLRAVKKLNPKLPTKTSLMLGLGETEEEVLATFRDLREASVDILTLGQYLRPGPEERFLPVTEFLTPERFERYGQQARQAGFGHVASGPLVRSSYRAGELFIEGMLKVKE